MLLTVTVNNTINLHVINSDSEQHHKPSACEPTKFVNVFARPTKTYFPRIDRTYNFHVRGRRGIVRFSCSELYVRFWQRCEWRLPSCGIWRRVVLSKLTHVSPKFRYVSTTLHVVICQKLLIFKLVGKMGVQPEAYSCSRKWGR